MVSANCVDGLANSIELGSDTSRYILGVPNHLMTTIA